MVNEKIIASIEIASSIQRNVLSIYTGSFNPWKASQHVIKPLHTKTTSNNRRLMKKITG